MMTLSYSIKKMAHRAFRPFVKGGRSDSRATLRTIKQYKTEGNVISAQPPIDEFVDGDHLPYKYVLTGFFATMVTQEMIGPGAQQFPSVLEFFAKNLNNYEPLLNPEALAMTAISLAVGISASLLVFLSDSIEIAKRHQPKDLVNLAILGFENGCFTEVMEYISRILKQDGNEDLRSQVYQIVEANDFESSPVDDYGAVALNFEIRKPRIFND